MPTFPPNRPGLHVAVVDSPLGPLTLAATEAGLAAVHFDRWRHAPPARDATDGDTDAPAAVAALLERAGRQLAEYFARRRTVFDVPLALEGTPFQRTVWEALRAIPFGGTLSYGALARRVGDAGAARAVGAANARNPVAIIVPCHRVVGHAGALTGYGGGMERKRWLLVHEGALPETLGAENRASSEPVGRRAGPF